MQDGIQMSRTFLLIASLKERFSVAFSSALCIDLISVPNLTA